MHILRIFSLFENNNNNIITILGDHYANLFFKDINIELLINKLSHIKHI